MRNESDAIASFIRSKFITIIVVDNNESIKPMKLDSSIIWYINYFKSN